MKKLLLLFFTFLVLAASCTHKNESRTDEKNQKTQNDSMMLLHHNKSDTIDGSYIMSTTIFTCPMDTEVRGKFNDKCFQCGLKLTAPVALKINPVK